ncbi:heat-inducible transcription repressor HrcA [Alkalispirillum mobile]|uniref:Heat-inducible transcription repressor HrcA n=2 Tax=Alkalispirillum mobile TaxID=85925 RepID=A0A498C3Q1_9GAMM|nr:heat-inducible transcription repressor HrcA [Alkalispirillum mobile]
MAVTTRGRGYNSLMSQPRETKELTPRARHLLRTLVQCYISDGRPVGSRTLLKASGLSVSSATVRNVMAELEDMGYVCSPHTSAGRQPTDKGYRFFVDTLLTARPWDNRELDRLALRLDGGERTDDLLGSASSLLSGLTHYAGVVTVPRQDLRALRHIDFLPLSGNRVLAIVVLNESEVENRVIETDRAYQESELRAISNYLNAQFGGCDVYRVRQALVEAMQHDRQRMDQLMQLAFEMGEKVFSEAEGEEDYVVAGETNLMALSELSDVDKLRELFRAFNEKQDILHLLDRCLSAEGVQIFIGQEAGYRVFDGCSLVTARYAVEGRPVGVLGVIGPTRMAYQRVIPIVDMTAQLLGAALNQSR